MKKYKHKGLVIRRFDNLYMFFVPKEVSKDRIYFTDHMFMKSIFYGTRNYLWANVWYNNKKIKQNETTPIQNKK